MEKQPKERQLNRDRLNTGGLRSIRSRVSVQFLTSMSRSLELNTDAWRVEMYNGDETKEASATSGDGPRYFDCEILLSNLSGVNVLEICLK